MDALRFALSDKWARVQVSPWGIAGLVGRSNEQVVSARFAGCATRFVHRGPDDEGIYARGSVHSVCGGSVSSIFRVDCQPTHNEDTSVWGRFQRRNPQLPGNRAGGSTIAATRFITTAIRK